MKTFKDLIKEKRIEKGLSQSKLAKALGYSTGQFVSNWERGESYPPVDRMAKLSLLFDLEKDILFDLFLKEHNEEKRAEYDKAHAFHTYNMKNF